MTAAHDNRVVFPKLMVSLLKPNPLQLPTGAAAKLILKLQLLLWVIKFFVFDLKVCVLCQ